MAVTCHLVREKVYLLSWVCHRNSYGYQVDTLIEDAGKRCTLSYGCVRKNSLNLMITNDSDGEVYPVTSVLATSNGLVELMKFNHPEWTALFEHHKIHPINGTYVFGFVIDFNPLTVLTAGSQRVIDQMLQLWETKLLSDVTFDVQSKTIAAHSQIIASGSPILAAMFQNNFREANDRVAVIKDVTPEVFEKLLRFIYTGNAGVDTQNVCKLFVAADMYGVDLLIEECELYMSRHLTTENACEYLVLAHLHHVPKLYESTLDFMSKNPQDICTRCDWLDIIKKYPLLSFEAMKRISMGCTSSSGQ